MSFVGERRYTFETDKAQGRFTSRVPSYLAGNSRAAFPKRVRAKSKDWGSDSVNLRRQHSNELDETTPLLPGEEPRGLHWVWDRITSVTFSSSFVLLLLGATTAVVDFGQNKCIALIQDYHTKAMDLVADEWAKYLIWIAYGVAMLTIAVKFTHYVSPVAAGSGIPEMKATLAGAEIDGLLSFPTLVSKIVGLVFGIGGGMSIGKEGPFVHTSAIIANQILRLPFARKLRANKMLTHQVLAAACAVGVSSTFGAPVGGVLFSIEVTTEYYMLSNYWKGFISAVASAVVSRLYRPKPYIEKYQSVKAPEYAYEIYEFFAFIVLGVIGGLVGAFFVRLHEFAILWRRKGPLANKTFQRIFPYLWGVLTMAIVYPIGWFMRQSLAQAMKDLMFNEDLGKLYGHEWSNRDVMSNIVLFTVLRIMLTVGAITLPIPTGVFAPILSIGCGLGRIVGEIMYMIDPNVSRGGYALMGAAAMAGGATRTISSAVIVFEVTQAPQFLLPSLVAVLISISVGNRLSRSIYDSILYTKGLPYLPRLSKLDKNKNKQAQELMDTTLIVVPQRMRFSQLATLLLDEDSALQSYPLVTDHEGMYLLGAVSRASLEIMLHDYLMVKGLIQPRHVEVPDGFEIEDAQDYVPSVFQLGITDEMIEQMNDDVHILSHPTAVIDPSPFQVVQEAPLSEIHFMFTMLRCSHLFVTHLGRLVGVIVLRDLMK